MAKSEYINVNDYFEKCTHPLRAVAEYLREVVSKIDTEIEEQIKWNSPTFCYTGKMKAFNLKEYKRDIVVFNLVKKDIILLVFPTGNKIEISENLKDKNLADGRKLLEISSMEDALAKENELIALIKTWLKLVEK